MQDSQILSTFGERKRPPKARPAPPPLVFDACQVGVILRAVLYVEAVIGVGLMYLTADLSDWLARVALVTGGALPATLLWLVLACALKRLLARLSWPLQAAAGVALGALAGLYACGTLALLGFAAAPPWLASASTGALLAAGLMAGLLWRVRGRQPAATTARLAELQSRIRPHFLFNTLNTAIALVRAEPAKAERVLEDLSDLFRHALAEQGDSATVGQEIELAQRYLEIEQLRFGERLRVEWALDERVHGARLPPLILQPLLENAVYHGIEPHPDIGMISVNVYRSRNELHIDIRNPYQPQAESQHNGNKMAMGNIRERLALFFDAEASLKATVGNNYYQVHIVVPYRE